MKKDAPKMSDLRKVFIQLGNERVVAWEPKDPAKRALGRWTDPEALLRRMYEIDHPEEFVPEGPGRQWQATWRGRFTGPAKPRSRDAA